jgi:hypothetical protein
VLIIIVSVLISQLFTTRDKYTEYNSVVINQVAGAIINQKNELYHFKEFYSSGNINFTKYQLINHYLTLEDIDCINQKQINECASFNVNDVSTPINLSNPVFQKNTCNQIEYGSNNEFHKIRILNYDYALNRSCINIIIEEIKILDTDKFLLTIKNDKAAQLLMLLKPYYITASMSYLYKILYENNQIHYNDSNNNPRKYNSENFTLYLIVEKVNIDSIYSTKYLIDINKIKSHENIGSKIECTNQSSEPNEYVMKNIVDYEVKDTAFTCSLTCYFLTLMQQTNHIIIELTNSISIYFNIDTSYNQNIDLYEIRRSAVGSQSVCKTFTVKLLNDTYKYINIILDEMPSLTYTIRLPNIDNSYKVFITYTLDKIQAYVFFESESRVKSFIHHVFDTNLVSSWSIKDVSDSINVYKCALPVECKPATSLCIPSFYDVVTSMKLL